MAKARRKRKNYTSQERTTIMAAAAKDGLTAAQVQKKFGVTPVTYYSWRKKTGVTRRRGGGGGITTVRVAARGGDLNAQLRTEVASRVRQILPEIVRTEVNNYLNSVFPGGNRKRGARV